ncbi:MAG: TetR/AcrR family transcriptional regulator [Sphingorhabdus sp.]
MGSAQHSHANDGSKKPKRRSQAERTATSDHQMLQAAVSLIALKGSTDWTLAEVGRNAGYTGGLVSHRFGSKNGLLLAVTNRIVELFVDKILGQSAQTQKPARRLISFFEVYAHQLQEGSDLFIAFHRLMADSHTTLPQLRPTFEAINVNLLTAIASALKEGQCDGSIRKNINMEFEAYAFVALFRGLTNLWMTGPRDLNLDEFVRYECEQFRRRILV